MIWSKAYVMERERYDGADVAHLIRARAEKLDWSRLMDRFGPHWRVLLSHLILFGFIYPADRLRIPDNVMLEFLRRLEEEMRSTPAEERLCQGTLLSWSQYLPRIERGEYEDARHIPRGTLTEEETALITDTLRQEQEAKW
ncbi:MAG: hypothetical protein C4293_20715 [Nitrospiraceae bacterium]